MLFNIFAPMFVFLSCQCFIQMRFNIRFCSTEQTVLCSFSDFLQKVRFNNLKSNNGIHTFYHYEFTVYNIILIPILQAACQV